MLSKNTKSDSTDEGLFITRKRKKYKFAKFDELENCFQFDEWLQLCHPGGSEFASDNLLSRSKKLEETKAIFVSGSRQILVTPDIIETEALPSGLSKTASHRITKRRTLSERTLGGPKGSASPTAIWRGRSPFRQNSSFCNPLILEIGAGTGLFSVELAKRHPKNFYVAVDIKSDRLYTGAKWATELGLKNVVFIRSDIWRISELFPKNSVSEIWITFPDPYANEDQIKLKTSDAKHRLTHPRFLDIYKQLLQACPAPLHPEGLKGAAASSLQGKLHFKTDNRPLYEWSKDQLKQNGWKIAELTNDLHGSDLSDDYKVKTSYEERFTADGLPIYYLTATIKA